MISWSNVLMRFRPTAAALLGTVFLAAPVAAVLAGPLDVKGPEIEKGETEISTNHSFQSGFPANADRVRHSFELAVGYAFSDRFKAGAKLQFDRPLSDDTQLSTAGIEGQVFLGKLGPTIALAWFTGLDMRVHRDETSTLVFGPLIKFGDDALSLTLNPLFEHTFGRNREDGLAIAYAAGLKTELHEGLAIGIEAHGSIPDIGNAPGADLQEHRIGPVVYIDREVSPARGGHGATKLSLEIGAFAGLTDATPDWTGKVKAALTW
jgi:hypothetical protein